MAKWFNVPVETSIPRELARVHELPSGRLLAEFKNLELVGMQDDATAVTTDDSEGVLLLWDLPLQPPKRLVLGIPSGLGLLIVALAWWRRRRKRAPPTMAGPSVHDPVRG